ncbi:hypothetical protein [Cohnella herbarum]|uniref:Uncharacterized protein n=1 Tax=Cohnella herbarum TaxID=2728023 RepID=A0A7Z2VIQ6_9BACL|nr:hypothetical protein [Cohnella herbarum]QJD84003.1 hypothetical protein HH215_12960 [Cohnella herbarum]
MKEVNGIAQLGEIIDYKNKITELILSDADLCKALYYSENNFLDQPEISDSALLLYSKVFPYLFVPKVETVPSTFLTVSAGGYSKVHDVYHSGLIIIRIFTHRDLHRTSYEYTRTDYVMRKMDGFLSNAKGFGIGRLQFNEMNPLTVNEDYQGVYLQYKCVDFN